MAASTFGTLTWREVKLSVAAKWTQDCVTLAPLHHPPVRHAIFTHLASVRHTDELSDIRIRLVVQKFGGTSVADPDAIVRLIEIVRRARVRDGGGPAVVVSAMSGVTDALLNLAACAGASRVDDALARVQQLRERHLTTARTLVPRSEPLCVEIEAQFDELTAVVKALAVLREVSPRTLDVVAAMGELLSSKIVTAALADRPSNRASPGRNTTPCARP